ncbi:MAG: transcriptional repressor [Ktedonobacteraceae bacterium]|nr:transcriptional repressor [Ktedonobacteraceae bacterium]
MIVERIRAAFQQAGQKNTRPRRLIAECLAERAASGMDFSIDDLWQALRQHDPHLGRATLYRSIEILVQEGFLDRIDFADGTHRYHVCVGRDHRHLTCIQCHCFIEVHVDLPLEQFTSIGTQANFTIEGLSFTLFGRCANCRLQENGYA